MRRQQYRAPISPQLGEKRNHPRRSPVVERRERLVEDQ
jgi:hypothetical protein